jgi:hypothetical protein
MTMKRYAFWSDQFVQRGHRTQVWSTIDGKEIEACFVLATATAPTTWSDIKSLGEVVEWVRNGQRSMSPPPAKR